MTHAKTPFTRLLLSSALGASLLLTAACDDTPSEPYPAAIAASEKGDFQSARLFLLQELKLNPDNADALMLSGKTHLALENPEGAAEDFKKLAEHPQLGAEAKDLLAKAFLQTGNSKKALEALAENGMRSGLAYAVSVVAYLNEGNADKALNQLDSGLAQFPNSPDLKVLDAKRAYDLGDVAKSRGVLTAVLNEKPNMLEARLLAGRLEMGAKQMSSAKEHFNAVLKSSPWNMPAILSLAAIAREEKDEATAQEWLKRAEEVAPGHPVGVYFAAQIAYDAGNVDHAHMLVQSLGTKSAEFPALRLLRGRISAERGQSSTAVAEFERFFRLGGNSPAARAMLAEQYMLTGANTKAWDILKPDLDRPNPNPVLLRLGAQVAAKLGLPEQASLASRAGRAKQADPYAADMVKAGAAIKAGKWDEADTLYQKVLKSGGERNPIVLNNASFVRLQKGDTTGAINLARKAIAIAPNDPIIMDTLGWALVKSDANSKEGKDLIRRAAALAPNNAEIAAHRKAIS